MELPDQGQKATTKAELPIALLAYAAGVIDSDGSIGIQRETWPMKMGRATQPTFSEHVTILQIEPEAIDLIHAHFGGARGVIRYRGDRHERQPLQSLVIGDRKATALLKAVIPYLRIKREQALLCLELRRLKDESRRARFAYGRGHQGGGRRPTGLSTAMEAVHTEMIRLNRVSDRATRHNPSLAVLGKATDQA